MDNTTYVLKVNLQCCNTCPNKIKRRLLRISGVNSVVMDMEGGLVKVSGKGNLDPSVIVNTIKKVGKLVKFQGVENPAAAAAEKATATATDSVVSDHHKNSPGKSDINDCTKMDKTQKGSSFSSLFSGKQGGSGNVHVNEAANAVPPVALPQPNRLIVQPQSQFGGGSFSGNSCYRPQYWSEPLPLPPPMPPSYRYYREAEPFPLPPPYRYYREAEPLPLPLPPSYRSYRESEPLPYYCQQQQPPWENAPGHYLFNDENTGGCVIV